MKKFLKSYKKGQAALEFLTTYGWAFLVILVAIGGLSYFGVFDIGRILPDGCKLDTNLECGDIYVLSAPAGGGVGRFQVELKNNRDRTIYIHSLSIIERGLQSAAVQGTPCFHEINAPPGTAFPINPDRYEPFDFNDLDDGSGASSDCGIDTNVDEKKTYEIEVVYTVQGSTIPLSANGELTTTVQGS